LPPTICSCWIRTASGFADCARRARGAGSAGDAAARQPIARELEHYVKNLIGVTVDVEVVDPFGIERVTIGKAKRVLDRRPKH
jgi:phenylacetate-coenzyme A ligase PaaK-like adenylate-forming protein